MPRLPRLLSCLLLAAATTSPAAERATLKELFDEARGGLETRTRGIDEQGNFYEMGSGIPAAPTDELDESERQRIVKAIEQNRLQLIRDGKLAPVHAKTITNFAWPLRQAAGRTDFNYHAISNFIDENPAYPNLLSDYMCGARTYDLASGYNHQGTDIFTWPFSWKKMDDEDVVIAAGAPGTIVNKSDGNFDRNCAMNNGTWNAVYVQHADGSVAWYGHMKSGSLTVKGVGETVVTGEYLGTVGSSGSSTGPHLHLELYDATNALVDPWLGPCNAKSKQVTWAQQRAYRDTGVNAMTVGNAAPAAPFTCPVYEVSNATDYVTPGGTAYFSVYMRDQTVSTPLAVHIIRPDGSVYASPSPLAGGDYNARYVYYFYSNFPSIPGPWTLEATFGGQTYTKIFYVGGAPGYGAPATITTLAGSAQSTPRGAAFGGRLRFKVIDSIGRPVQGAKVVFGFPLSGATAVLESRTALTDESGIASASAIANATVGSYVVNASVAGAGNVATVLLQNLAIVPAALTVGKNGTGTGTVSAAEIGIACGATCATSVNVGTLVTLVPAASPGSAFTGWSGGGCSGTGACTFTMNAATSVTATFDLPTAATPRAANISTRIQVLTGNDVMIGGFVIGGSVAKTVVIRARGPSLIPAGIPNALANPKLDLYSGQTVIASNDDWATAANAAALTASGFAPGNALESAILITLNPGAYTAVVSGVGNTTGVGIVEVFELDHPDAPLINIATRGQVLTGNDVMIGGFIIQGNSPQTVVVRARGPSLVPFGINNALANPVLQLFSGPNMIASNDDWQVAANVSALQASGFAPANALESAILITLNPGAYTAIVTGFGGGTGVGIIEVFAQ